VIRPTGRIGDPTLDLTHDVERLREPRRLAAASQGVRVQDERAVVGRAAFLPPARELPRRQTDGAHRRTPSPPRHAVTDETPDRHHAAPALARRLVVEGQREDRVVG